MRMSGLVSIQAIALLLASITAPALADRRGSGPIPGERIRDLIVGNTVFGPWHARLYDFGYTAEGSVYGTLDHGTWRIRDGERYCHQWVNLFDATERCYQWYELGAGRYRMVNVDSYRTLDIDVWRIEPGLP